MVGLSAVVCILPSRGARRSGAPTGAPWGGWCCGLCRTVGAWAGAYGVGAKAVGAPAVGASADRAVSAEAVGVVVAEELAVEATLGDPEAGAWVAGWGRRGAVVAAGGGRRNSHGGDGPRRGGRRAGRLGARSKRLGLGACVPSVLDGSPFEWGSCWRGRRGCDGCNYWSGVRRGCSWSYRVGSDGSNNWSGI